MKIKYLILIICALCFSFVNTTAQDSKHEKWHQYINMKGEEVLKVSAVRINAFSEGMARVEKYFWDGGAQAYNNYGYIDVTGKLVIQHQYDKASDFNYGVASVRKRGEDFFRVIDQSGKLITDKKFPKDPLIHNDMIIWREDKSLGVMDTKGNLVVPVGKYVDFGGYDEYGLCCVAIEKDPNTWLYGFIDKKGKEVIPCTYKQDGTSSFIDGLARMRMTNGKIGFIDTLGKIVIPGLYGTAEYHMEGYYPVAFGKNRTLWGLVDKNNKTVVAGKYDDLKLYRGGIAKVELKEKWGFIRVDGSEFISLTYDEVLFDMDEEGLAVCSRMSEVNKFDVFVADGTKISSDSKRPISCNKSEGWIVYKDMNTGKNGVMNYSGEILLAPGRFCHISPFSDGLAPVKLCD
jgi:hypothetical protein